MDTKSSEQLLSWVEERVLTKKGSLKYQPPRKNGQTLLQNLIISETFHIAQVPQMGNIILQAPPRGASTFFNYNKSFSIVLLTVCNTNYDFTIVNSGEASWQSDRGI